MSEGQALESIIVADCGKALTRVSLVEMVEGVCRFVAQGTSPSTAEAPHDDVGAGLRAALGALEEATMRRFIERNRLAMPQEDTGDGVDAFLATVAVAPPLRVAMLTSGGGTMVDALLTIARRSPVTVLPTLTAEPGGPSGDTTRVTVATLKRLRPDLLLIVAPTDVERALPRLLGLASEIVGPTIVGEDGPSPAILVIADQRGQDAAAAAFGRGYEFGFLPINDSDPATIALTVEAELLDLGNRRASATLPGFEAVESLSAAPPLARARAIDLVNRFMAIQFDCEVLTVDLDEGFTCCWARGGEGRALSEPALDLALGAANLLTALPLGEVLRWLPFSMSEAGLREWILNRAVRPFTIPVSRKDRLIEVAIVRELLRIGASELGGTGKSALSPDLLVAGSFFARWPDPLDVFMALIDGLNPQPASGVVQVAIDREALLPLIGTLGALEPDRAAELFEHDGLVDLGACVVVSCPAGEEVKGELVYQDGQTRKFAVTGGSLLHLPLAGGERAASLQFSAGGRASIGRNGQGRGASFAGDLAPHGGLVGLVIDARERPIALPRNEQERIERLAGWSAALHS
jgi:hypothetical protein